MRLTKLHYFILIFILFLAHGVFALTTMHQIRYEELAETVRNVYWLQNRLIYDGISTNIGWPIVLLIVYKTFGFSIFTAKYARLFLLLLSLISLATLLKRKIGIRLAFVPLLTIFLSPTLLYFSTMQAQYGMDLLYLPISLLIFDLIDYKKPNQAYSLTILAWLITMIGWMSYPSFVFYLPAIALFYFNILRKNGKLTAKNLIISAVSFFTPLILIYLYIENKQILILDPMSNSGIFRGGGLLMFDIGVLINNINLLFNYLFNEGFGYYYEVKNVEFSGYFPIISIFIIAYLNIVIFKKFKKLRLLILITTLSLLFNLIIGGLTDDPTLGIRRYTPVLVSIYILFIIAWRYILTKSNLKVKSLLIAGLLVLPIHHILVFPSNLSFSQQLSPYRDYQWFSQNGPPDKSLEILTQRIQIADLNLACKDENNNFTPCRYSEIYPAVAGTCLWNKLGCHNIYGFDQKTEKFIPLSPKLWDEHYFGH